MPICITCSTPVRNLYTTYSKADDRSLGKGVRLTQCPNCKRFADKYVEHDYVVLFIDLVLIKPQVYRHLLFNRIGRTDNKLDPSILRLGILLILFDVYITWARIEKSNNNNSTSSHDLNILENNTTTNNFSTAPIITQYLFFLTLNVIATLAQHLTIRVLVQLLNSPVSIKARRYSIDKLNDITTNLRGSPSKLQSRSSPNPSSSSPLDGFTPINNNNSHHDDGRSPSTQPPFPGPAAINTIDTNHASPSAISTALLVSSCTKLFPILLVIWPTTTPSSSSTSSSSTSTSSSLASFTHRATSYIGWIVLLNNVEALLILLNCGYIVATGLAVSGLLARWVVEGWLLGVVGLVRDGEGDGPVGDFIALLAWGWRRGAA